MNCCGKSISNTDIQRIQQAKYNIIYSHLEVFLGPLRKLLDNDRVVDEAHLIEEWHVNISSFLLVFTVSK